MGAIEGEREGVGGKWPVSVSGKVKSEEMEMEGERERNALLHVPEEPPIAQMPDDSERIHDFTSADECKTEECGTGDDLGVVQVPVPPTPKPTPPLPPPKKFVR